MALTRRTGSRFTANIWPGFVDAMTALLLVLMFVLSIFMIVQSILRTTVSSQEDELNDLAGQVASLAEALGLEQQSNDQLETRIGQLDSQLDDATSRADQQSALISSLTIERDSALEDNASLSTRISSFEAQVATLLAQNADLAGALEERDTALVDREAELDVARASISDLEAANSREISEKEALNLALAKARDEIDASAEEARLAAARREAMEALIADLRREALLQDEEIAARERDLAGKVAELEQSDEAIELARAQQAALEAMVASLRADLSSSSKNADAREAELAEALLLLTATKEDLARAREAMEADRTSELSAQLNEAQRDLQDAERAQLIQIAATEALREKLQNVEAELTEKEAQQLADAAAAAALRERLENADTELTAMTLSLEAQRKKAEETLTMLAAARAANNRLELSAAERLSQRDKSQLLLDQANTLLNEEIEKSTKAQLQVELLNQQTAELRKQLGSLQALLDAASAKDATAKVQIEALGKNLNSALARVAAEQKKRAAEQERIAELEAAEVARLAAEAQDLRRYRSEFFGRVRDILGDRQGVQIQGDRFVFSSEVLFPAGSATLGAAGQRQISGVAAVLREVSDQIPDEINWILRVDGHTDKSPLGQNGPFADNWELSQARALSVVRYLIAREGIPSNRLAATGFGEFQPIDTGDDLEALARNRRIELKFTEK